MLLFAILDPPSDVNTMALPQTAVMKSSRPMPRVHPCYTLYRRPPDNYTADHTDQSKPIQVKLLQCAALVSYNLSHKRSAQLSWRMLSGRPCSLKGRGLGGPPGSQWSDGTGSGHQCQSKSGQALVPSCHVVQQTYLSTSSAISAPYSPCMQHYFPYLQRGHEDFVTFEAFKTFFAELKHD